MLLRFFSLAVVPLVLLGLGSAKAQANDMFPTRAGAEKRAKELNCKGVQVMGSDWMPCSNFEAYEKAVSKQK